MRRIYLKPKYKNQAQAIARREDKRGQQRKARLKHLAKLKKKRPHKKRKEVARQLNSTNVIIPRNFSFITNPEVVIGVISQLEEILDKGRSVFVNMENVEKIDYAAISALLSLMFVFKSENVPFNGNFPSNIDAANMLRGSGFLYQLFENKSEKVKYEIGTANQILTQVDKKLDPGLLTTVIGDAAKTIWDEPRRSQGLSRVILELIDNTHDHAAGLKKGTQRWWLSVNHDASSKTVSFVFLDYGVGIFTSLAKKPTDSTLGAFMKGLQQKWGLSAADEYLKAIMSTPIRNTSSDKKGRGHGLYGIGQTVTRNQISDLHIISNNAFGDVDNSRYEKLNQSFNGTLFYWKLSYNNRNSPWIKNL
jgi:hypothetical protein